MSALKVLALGVGDAFSALHYSTSLAVGADDTWLLVDCAHPIRKVLRESSAAAGLALDVGDIHAVLVSHLHADHASGLEGFAFYVRYVLKDKPTRLYAHPGVSAKLWDCNLAGSMEWSVPEPGAKPRQRKLKDFWDLRDLTEAKPTRVGPFSVECRLTLHSIPTTAFLIRAGGRCVGYSADTAFDPGLIEWLDAADLIIHEAAGGPLHTDYAQLAALPERVRAKIKLIHFPDQFDAQNCGIEAVRQGRCYDV